MTPHSLFFAPERGGVIQSTKMKLKKKEFAFFYERETIYGFFLKEYQLLTLSCSPCCLLLILVGVVFVVVLRLLVLDCR